MMVTIWYERGARRPVGPSWHWHQATTYDLFHVYRTLTGLALELGDSERADGRRSAGRLVLPDDAGGRQIEVDPEDVVIFARRDDEEDPIEYDWQMATGPSGMQARFGAFLVEQALRYQLGMAMAGAQAQQMAADQRDNAVREAILRGQHRRPLNG